MIRCAECHSKDNLTNEEIFIFEKKQAVFCSKECLSSFKQRTKDDIFLNFNDIIKEINENKQEEKIKENIDIDIELTKQEEYDKGYNKGVINHCFPSEQQINKQYINDEPCLNKES